MKQKKDRNKATGCAVGFFLFLFVIGITAVARADLQDLLLKFQPYVWAQEEYTSNVFFTSKNTKSDFITTISPGIRFSTVGRSPVTGELKQGPPLASALGWKPPTEKEKVGVEFDYRPAFVFYSKETDNNYVSQNGTLNAWYAIDPGLKFRLSEYIIRSQEPREPEYAGFSRGDISSSFGNLPPLYLPGTQRHRFTYLRNVVTPAVEYVFGKDSSIGLDYRNNVYRTEDPAGQDSQENFINPRLTHWFNIRNGITLDYGLTFGSFQRSPDLTSNAITGRYTYRFNPRTSVFGEYAFSSQKFDSPGIDYDVQTPVVGFVHAFSPTFSLEARAGYFWQNPGKGSGEDGPVYTLILSQRDVRTVYSLLFEGGYRNNFFANAVEARGFIRYHRIVGAVNYRFTENITGGLSGNFEYQKSDLQESGAATQVNQRSHLWGANGNVVYKLLKWLNLSVTLSYRGDHSNISSLDYTEFRGMFRIEATYK